MSYSKKKSAKDVARMSTICNFYHGTNFQNLLVTKFSSTSMSSYAGLLASGRFHAFIINTPEEYELTKVLSSKIDELFAYVKYEKESKDFYQLLEAHSKNDLFAELLATDLEVHDKKQKNAETLIKG